MEIKEEDTDTVSNIGTCRTLCTVRWRLTLLIFVANMILYMHRVNMSFAIVCMANTLPSVVVKGEHRNHSDCGLNETRCGEGGLIDTSSTTQTSADLSTTEADVDLYCKSIETSTDQGWTPELDWDKPTVAFLLSSYFYGSFVTQVPAGRAADRFGAKYIILASMTVAAICSFLAPLFARTSIYLMFVIRIATGLAGGSVIPSTISMFNVWAPVNERAPMITVSSAGYFVGVVFTYCTSGLLCSYGFANGWPSIFYIHGVITMLFACVWWYDAFNTPSQHPRIPKLELQFLKESTQDISKIANTKTPWNGLWSSKPMWAAIIAHFSLQWSFYTVLINVPMFMKEVLRFDIQQNGVYSSIPYAFFIVAVLLWAKLASFLINRHLLQVVTTRRLMTALGFLGSACCLVAAGHVTCDARYLAIVLLCLACIFKAMCFSGVLVNHPEFAGRFAGTAFGITNGIGVVAAIISSMSAGLLTPNGLQQEWKIVFYIAAAVNVVGTVVYITWSSSTLQEWAIITEENTTATDDVKPKKEIVSHVISQCAPVICKNGVISDESTYM